MNIHHFLTIKYFLDITYKKTIQHTCNRLSAPALIMILTTLSLEAWADTPLNDHIYKNIIPWTVEKRSDIEFVTARFNKTLGLNQGVGLILNCTSIVSLKVGGKYGNVSYGAICDNLKVENTSRVFICADQMLGHLFVTAKYIDTEEWRVKATGDNCVGGG